MKERFVIPSPPDRLCASLESEFTVADLKDWVVDSFLEQGSKFYNPEHSHLLSAEIGYLWSNVPNVKRMRRIIGQAQTGKAMAKGKWAKAREEFQVKQWFGCEPDFIITLDALAWIGISEIQRLALIDHELYHCAQAVDGFGLPKFSKTTGRPIFAIRGHDVEDFIGVARRWGAVDKNLEEFSFALNSRPEFNPAEIAQMCGT